MMATDMQEVRNQLISYARNSVGQYLSRIPGPNNTEYPAVVKSIKNNTEAKPPFIVLNIDSRRRQARNVLRQQILNNNETEYENHYDYLCSYTVVGGDAFKIACDLASEFSIQSSTEDMQRNGVFFLDSEEPIEDEDQFNSELINISILNFTVTVPDITRKDEGCIDSVSLTGELRKDENDSSPIPLEFDV